MTSLKMLALCTATTIGLCIGFFGARSQLAAFGGGLFIGIFGTITAIAALLDYRERVRERAELLPRAFAKRGRW